MTEVWENALKSLRYAFQPIVLCSGARVYGYEALLRGYKEAGFESIGSVFDCAYIEGLLPEFDQALRAKAFADFAQWAPSGTKIFFNVDNRIFKHSEQAVGGTLAIAQGLGLSSSRIILEISERHELEGDLAFEQVITRCREMDLRIAIDDFGSGFAGLKLLHMSQPDIVKIDRHFVTGSDAEPRKAAFLGKIVGMAHLMGVSVVAEGIETEAELAVCVEAGCDMIQGYLLARPACGRDAFVQSFPALSGEASGARRGRHRGLGIAASSPKFVPPMHRSDDLLDVLGRFRKEPELDIIPVVDDSDEPIGVYLERDFRQYVYSPFGIALLEHLKSGKGAASFLRKAPTACLGVDLAGILEVFGGLPASGGVLLTRESKYAGLIPAVELLSLVAERDVAEARDQNPLTRLPGNLRVAELIAQRAAELERSRAFIYFDFDDFKPFNDRYGFRLGDRVIQLFADILRSVFGQPDCFVGHLGGDDFFASSYATSIDEALGLAGEASARFGREASSFYSVEDRERGWILGRDRAGEERRMPTMGLSFAIVLAAPGAQPDAESLSDIFAVLKKRAKTSSSHAAYRVLGAQGEEGPTLSPESLGPAGRELGAQGGGLVRYLPYALYKRGREAEDPPHLGEREVASALHLG